MGWANAAIAILQLLPTLVTTVEQVVRALNRGENDVPGQGAAKKELAMTAIAASMDAAVASTPSYSDDDSKVKDALLDVASKMVDEQVRFDKVVSVASADAPVA